MLKEILEYYPEEELLKANGFDDAVIGVDWGSMRLIYSVKKCVEILKEYMTTEEAIEFFDYNLRQSYLGEKTPIWCEDDF
jgi:hypothetical protein